MGIAQELTHARERVALLDDVPRSNGSNAPSRVSGNATPEELLGPEHAFSKPCGTITWPFTHVCCLRGRVSQRHACKQTCRIDGITAACRAASSRRLPRWKHSEGL